MFLHSSTLLFRKCGEIIMYNAMHFVMRENENIGISSMSSSLSPSSSSLVSNLNRKVAIDDAVAGLLQSSKKRAKVEGAAKRNEQQRKRKQKERQKQQQQERQQKCSSSLPSCSLGDLHTGCAIGGKKRKRSSPFRIKVGCVVALRYRSGGNRITSLGKPLQSPLSSFEEYVEVWTDPLPGRDEGLALIGKCVRCCFITDDARTARKRNYIIEGEIISIVDYGNQWKMTRQQEESHGRQSSFLQNRGITVELLVDIDKMNSIPFLKRTDEVIDFTKFKSEAAKRSFKHEQTIRGKNKAIITVILAVDDLHNYSNSGNDNGTSRPLVNKWAIRKRVLTKRQTSRKRKTITKNQNITFSTLQEGKYEGRKAKEQVNFSKNGTCSDKNSKSSDSDRNKDEENVNNNGKIEKSNEESKNGEAKKNESAAGSSISKRTQQQVDILGSDSGNRKNDNKTDSNGATTTNTANSNGIKKNNKKKRQRDEISTNNVSTNNINTKVVINNNKAYYVGDNNDNETQQKANFRWVAKKQHDLSLFLDHSNVYNKYTELFSNTTFIGEVIKVEPIIPPKSTTAKTTLSSSLAMVSLRRLVLPEYTARGRLPHHGPFDIFDDFDSSFSLSFQQLQDQQQWEGQIGNNNKTCSNSSQNNSLLSFQVPIEELVIISRKIRRSSTTFVRLPCNSQYTNGFEVSNNSSFAHEQEGQCQMQEVKEKQQHLSKCDCGGIASAPASASASAFAFASSSPTNPVFSPSAGIVFDYESQLEISLSYSLWKDRFMSLALLEENWDKQQQKEKRQGTKKNANINTVGTSIFVESPSFCDWLQQRLQQYPFCHHCCTYMQQSDLMGCSPTKFSTTMSNFNNFNNYYWCRSCLHAMESSVVSFDVNGRSERLANDANNTTNSKYKSIIGHNNNKSSSGSNNNNTISSNSRKNDDKRTRDHEEKLLMSFYLGRCDCRECCLVANTDQCEADFCNTIKAAVGRWKDQQAQLKREQQQQRETLKQKKKQNSHISQHEVHDDDDDNVFHNNDVEDYHDENENDSHSSPSSSSVRVDANDVDRGSAHDRKNVKYEKKNNKNSTNDLLGEKEKNNNYTRDSNEKRSNGTFFTSSIALLNLMDHTDFNLPCNFSGLNSFLPVPSGKLITQSKSQVRISSSSSLSSATTTRRGGTVMEKATIAATTTATTRTLKRGAGRDVVKTAKKYNNNSNKNNNNSNNRDKRASGAAGSAFSKTESAPKIRDHKNYNILLKGPSCSSKLLPHFELKALLGAGHKIVVSDDNCNKDSSSWDLAASTTGGSGTSVACGSGSSSGSDSGRGDGSTSLLGTFISREKPRNLREIKRNNHLATTTAGGSSGGCCDNGDCGTGGNGGDNAGGGTDGGDSVAPKNNNTSRAQRANQRRLMKDVASFAKIGRKVNNNTASSLFSNLGLDALVGREQQLRFDRSSIHAWGVFTDVNINAGEMIVEYKGELIGNAMAEKREKEYELANIGSDYMFRVDAYCVCDATKQGNVARFINASCDPNCFTKIILLNGVKRIAIYAKRNIQAEEELCYDYKFSLEYDESKRIPCYCGSRDCRGYMNWDKRYVAIPGSAAKDSATATSSSRSTRYKSNGQMGKKRKIYFSK